MKQQSRFQANRLRLILGDAGLSNTIGSRLRIILAMVAISAVLSIQYMQNSRPRQR
jgi:hypothetical protein